MIESRTRRDVSDRTRVTAWLLRDTVAVPATAAVGAAQGSLSAFCGRQSVATHTTVEGEKR
jgi:hypothetical protein